MADDANNGDGTIYVHVDAAGGVTVGPPPGPVGGQAATTLPGEFAFRVDWGPQHGVVVLTLSSNGINAKSRVFVAASEGRDPGPDSGKFIGNARFSVLNVAPWDDRGHGFVATRFNIEWAVPLRLYADYLVINRPW